MQIANKHGIKIKENYLLKYTLIHVTERKCAIAQFPNFCLVTIIYFNEIRVYFEPIRPGARAT
jgi:hypothetical protein